MKLFSPLLLLLIINSNVFGQDDTGLHFTLLGGAFISPADRVEIDNLTAKHGTSFAFGGRITNWLTPTMGVEASVNYTQSPLKGGNDLAGEALDGALLFSALKFVFAPNEDKYMQFGIGFGFVTSSYDFYLEGDTHPAIVASFALFNPINENLAIHLSVEDYVHTVYWTIGDIRTKEILQNDITIGIGLTIYR